MNTYFAISAMGYDIEGDGDGVVTYLKYKSSFDLYIKYNQYAIVFIINN